jgi:hypothetical protein
MAQEFKNFCLVFATITLVIIFFVSMWYFTVAYRYKKRLDNFAYTRGAHTIGTGKTVQLACEPGKKICIEHATQICSNPDEDNFENKDTDPISSGKGEDFTGYYGQFNTKTTVDLKSKLKELCGGQESCDYNFSGVQFPEPIKCDSNNTQLILTYTCIPQDAVCL